MDLTRERTQKRFEQNLKQNLENIETSMNIFNKTHSYNSRIVKNELKKIRDSRRKMIVSDLENWELKWAARPVRATNAKKDVEEVIQLVKQAPVRRKPLASLPHLPANKLSKELSILNEPSRGTTPINSNKDCSKTDCSTTRSDHTLLSSKTGFSTTRSDHTPLFSKTGFITKTADHTPILCPSLPPIDSPCDNDSSGLDSDQVTSKDEELQKVTKALGKWSMLSKVILSSKISETDEQDDDTITTYSMTSRRPSVSTTIDIGNFSDRLRSNSSRRSSDAFIKPVSSELSFRRHSDVAGRRSSLSGIREGQMQDRRHSLPLPHIPNKTTSIGANWRRLKRQAKASKRREEQRNQEQKGSETRKISNMTSDSVIRKFIEFMFTKLKERQEKKVVGTLEYLKECRYLRTT